MSKVAPHDDTGAPTPATMEREPQPPYALLEPYDVIEFQRLVSNSPEALKAFARKQAMCVHTSPPFLFTYPQLLKDAHILLLPLHAAQASCADVLHASPMDLKACI